MCMANGQGRGELDMCKNGILMLVRSWICEKAAGVDYATPLYRPVDWQTSLCRGHVEDLAVPKQTGLEGQTAIQ